MSKNWTTDQHPLHPWTNPGGRLVISATADRDAWLDERRKMVCASDVGALMGVSKYGDALTVWADKTGQTAPEPPNDAMRRGQLLEDAIVNLWAERYADFPIETRRQGLVQSKRWPHLGATVDRLSICMLDGAAHRCCIEAKSQADLSEWFGDNGEPEVPVAFQFQGQTQLAATGRSHVHYIGLGPRFVPEHRIIWRDEPLIEAIGETVETFWADYVATGIAPKPTDKALDTVRGMYVGSGGVAYASDELAPFISVAREAKELMDSAKADYEAAQAAIMLHMGEATELRWPGEDKPTITWKPGKTIDGANADWRKAHPDLVDAYSVPGPDKLALDKMVESHPELIETRSLRYRRTFSWK